jgi:hypothetical protein
MKAIRKLLAPFEIIEYAREDGNQAIYKIFRPMKKALTNKGLVVGFKSWKMRDSGASVAPGWRSFRFDRIQKRRYTFS